MPIQCFQEWNPQFEFYHFKARLVPPPAPLLFRVACWTCALSLLFTLALATFALVECTIGIFLTYLIGA